MPERHRAGGRPSQLHVTLTPEDRATLEDWLRRSSLPYGLHKRARAVLLLADGLQVAEIARRVDMGRHHVYMWIRRFQAQGIDGLHDLTRDAWRGRRKKEEL
jgi:hypothetical protein